MYVREILAAEKTVLLNVLLGSMGITTETSLGSALNVFRTDLYS
jgi:hypothetical protein